jgi:hypothetical protein
MKSLKTYIVYGFTVLLLIGLFTLFLGIFTEGKTSEITNKPFNNPSNPFQDFSNTLWNNWGVAIVIIAIIIFASGTGILVLLRGT